MPLDKIKLNKIHSKKRKSDKVALSYEDHSPLHMGFRKLITKFILTFKQKFL